MTTSSKNHCCVRWSCGILLLFSFFFLDGRGAWAQEGKRLKAELQKPVRVPFELVKTQHMVVKAKINGKGPYTLVFDTGAPITLLSQKIGKEARVFDKKSRKGLFSPFGALGQVKINVLEVGGVKAEGVSAVVMDHPTIKVMAQHLNRPIEGIVGFPFFARFRMTIDYQARELTFVPNGFDPPEMLDSLTKMLESGAPRKQFLSPGGVLGFKVAKNASDQKPGVTIQEVFAGSPAAASGLKAGDRLLVLDGRWTDSVLDTFDAATSLRPGTEIDMVIERAGKQETKKLKVQPGF